MDRPTPGCDPPLPPPNCPFCTHVKCSIIHLALCFATASSDENSSLAHTHTRTHTHAHTSTHARTHARTHHTHTHTLTHTHMYTHTHTNTRAHAHTHTHTHTHTLTHTHVRTTACTHDAHRGPSKVYHTTKQTRVPQSCTTCNPSQHKLLSDVLGAHANSRKRHTNRRGEN